MSNSQIVGKGKLPVMLQAERSECALACLAMVLAYFGHKIDLNTLRSRYRVSQHGITLKSVVNLAAKLNLAVRPLRLEMEDIGNLAKPAILHWDLDHFVILKKSSLKYIEIHNPAVGLQKISKKVAGKHFTGVALELLPTPAFKAKNEVHKLSLGELWRHTDGLATGIVQLLVLSILLQVFAISLPFYTQLLLDDVLINFDVDLLKLLAAGFCLLTIFRQLTEFLRAHVVLYLSNKISFQFATRLCRHLLSLPLDYFSSRHIGDLVSRFGSLNNVRDFLCSGIVQIFIDGLMVVGALVLMFFYDTVLTSMALVAVLIYAFIRVASYQQFHSRNEEWIHDRALENTLFMENVSSIQGIKLFGRESTRLSSWQNSYGATIQSGIKVQKLGITVQFFHGLLIGLENILLLLVGCYSVLNGTLTVGMLMAFISFKDHFYRSTFSLVDKLFEFKLLDIHLGRLADITYTRPEISVGQEILPCETKSKDNNFKLENIAYGYDVDGPALFKNISLEIACDEIVAIIGQTGCGKSTLLKIVLSLIKPMQGKVLLNGKSIEQNSLEYFRKQVSGVLQNDTLLSGSILENITFFDSTPDLEKVHRVVKMAMLIDEIGMMPMQLNTMVGNMGSALSGGQVQRILLARALYHEPSLLVLDEATSHLDIKTEKGINNAIRSLGTPCLMVAHRPETVLSADRIFFLSPTSLHKISHDEFSCMVTGQLAASP